MSYSIPKEIKTEVKINKWLYVKDAIFIAIYMTVAYMFESMVYAPFSILYYVFSVVVAIYLSAPSIANPKRRNWQSFMIYIAKIRETQFFRPIIIREYSRERKK